MRKSYSKHLCYLSFITDCNSTISFRQTVFITLCGNEKCLNYATMQIYNAYVQLFLKFCFKLSDYESIHACVRACVRPSIHQPVRHYNRYRKRIRMVLFIRNFVDRNSGTKRSCTEIWTLEVCVLVQKSFVCSLVYMHFRYVRSVFLF